MKGGCLFAIVLAGCVICQATRQALAYDSASPLGFPSQEDLKPSIPNDPPPVEAAPPSPKAEAAPSRTERADNDWLKENLYGTWCGLKNLNNKVEFHKNHFHVNDGSTNVEKYTLNKSVALIAWHVDSVDVNLSEWSAKTKQTERWAVRVTFPQSHVINVHIVAWNGPDIQFKRCQKHPIDDWLDFEDKDD